MHEILGRRIGSDKNPTGGSPKASWWSFDDMLEMSAHWPQDIIDALPTVPAPGADEGTDAIRAVATGQTVTIQGNRYRVQPIDSADRSDKRAVEVEIKCLSGSDEWSLDSFLTSPVNLVVNA